MTTQIPTDTPVKLLRIYHGKTGNVYMPGEYSPGTLPKAAYNSYYVTPLIVSTKKSDTKAFSKSGDLKNGSFESELIERDASVSGVTEEVRINKTLRPEDKHLKSKTHKTVKAPSLKVNEASNEELVALNGVAKSTAKKVLELRDASAFIDYQDLNGRVPLPFGKDWTSFDISFE